MKNLLLFFAAALLLSGCFASAASHVYGGLYTDVKGPITATSNRVATKAGTSEATSILGLVATGDASISAAAQKGGIKSISHVDYHTTSILGIFAKFQVTVYGE